MNTAMEPKVIFEDTVLMVIDKPAGMTVNKADTTKGEETVQDWVESRSKIKDQVLEIDRETDFYKRAGIVHRLDKETSGVLLVAKTQEAFENLQLQFKERKVEKKYIALVHGKVSLEEGEITVPVGRLPWNRKRFGVLSGGREASTKYKVISGYTLSSYTLLELYPKTGRTHQIRVHLKYFGHPIVSDPLYGGRKQARNDRKVLPRVFLHASRIGFYHPLTKEFIFYESLLPKELEEFLEKMLKFK